MGRVLLVHGCQGQPLGVVWPVAEAKDCLSLHLFNSRSAPAHPLVKEKAQGSFIHHTHADLGKYRSLRTGKLFEPNCVKLSRMSRPRSSLLRVGIHPSLYLPGRMGSLRPHLPRGGAAEHCSDFHRSSLGVSRPAGTRPRDLSDSSPGPPFCLCSHLGLWHMRFLCAWKALVAHTLTPSGLCSNVALSKLPIENDP